MKKKAVTQWFYAHSIPPVHEGEYEFLYAGCDRPFRVKWCRWQYLIADGSVCDGIPLIPSVGDQWRGLAEKP
jgi:hypothetical protein